MPGKGEKVRDYVLKNRVGRGSYGEVWLAEKTIEFSSKGIQFALKFLAGEGGKEIDFTSVRQEVSTWIEAGNHPNIISVADAFMHDDFFVLVGQYAEGGSLREWLKANGRKAPSNEEATRIIKGILSGLVHLHSRKIIHRDLKPENILLRGGFPCITDFGVSRMLEKTGLHTTKMAGSPLYMSPEAFTGNKAPQTDVWSMGVIFQEMLCGTLPFYTENIYALMDSIKNDAPKALPPSVPRPFAEIIERALKKNPAERYKTAANMLEAIETAERTLAIRPSPNNTLDSTIIDEDFDEKKYQPEPTKPKPSQPKPKPFQLFTDEEKEEREKTKPSQPKPNVVTPATSTQKTKIDKSTWLALGVVGLLAVVILFVALAISTLKNETTNNPPTNTERTTNTNSKTRTANLPNGVKLEMVLIPSGSFWMGSSESEVDDALRNCGSNCEREWFTREMPQHRVTIGYEFYMGKFEVTQAQWRAVMGSNPSHFENCDNCPVERVSWNDAQDFIKRLNALNDGFTYRLPSEAEWEYACRAGTTTAFSFGDSLSSSQANFDGNYPYGGASKGVYKEKTTLVGSYQPNAWGLYDMHGNVWEWVEDIYQDNYNGLPTDGSANVSKGDLSKRVVRGGGWYGDGDLLRSAFRLRVAPDFRYYYYGFRVVARPRT